VEGDGDQATVIATTTPAAAATSAAAATDGQEDSEDIEHLDLTELKGLKVPEYEDANAEVEEQQDMPGISPDAKCYICGGDTYGDEDPLLLCEGCHRVIHSTCMDDMLPEGKQHKGQYKCVDCLPFDLADDPFSIVGRGKYKDAAEDFELLEYLRSGRMATCKPRIKSRSELYEWDSSSGTLQTKDGRIVPSMDQRAPLIMAAHVRLGHRASRAVSDALRQQFQWKGMREQVKEVIATCERCIGKGAKPIVSAQLNSIPAEPLFHKWTIDLIGKLPTDETEGWEYILVGVDSFSRWLEVVGLKDKESATVARALKGSIFYRYGPPKILACDRGGEFMGAVKELCEEFGTKLVRGAPYHPMSQGIVERANKSLQEALFSYVSGDTKHRWGDYLYQSAAAAGRMVLHSSTGHTPYQLLFGREPPGPVSLASVPSLQQGSAPSPAQAQEIQGSTSKRKAAIDRAAPKVAKKQEAAQKKQKRDYAARTASKQVTPPPTPGSYVMVKISRTKKGDDKTAGPFLYVAPSTKTDYGILRDGKDELFEEAHRDMLVISPK
jgi:transposase InsO family protein